MERAISYINVMPDTKTGIDLFIEKVCNEIEPRQALPLLIKLTAMEKITEGLRERIKDMILDEADLYPEKSFAVQGVRFDKKKKTNYYYHHCASHEALKAKLNAMEEMMKIGEYIDGETSEVIPAALKSESNYLSVTLSK